MKPTWERSAAPSPPPMTALSAGLDAMSVASAGPRWVYEVPSAVTLFAALLQGLSPPRGRPFQAPSACTTRTVLIGWPVTRAPRDDGDDDASQGPTVALIRYCRAKSSILGRPRISSMQGMYRSYLLIAVIENVVESQDTVVGGMVEGKSRLKHPTSWMSAVADNANPHPVELQMYLRSLRATGVQEYLTSTIPSRRCKTMIGWNYVPTRESSRSSRDLSGRLVPDLLYHLSWHILGMCDSSPGLVGPSEAAVRGMGYPIPPYPYVRHHARANVNCQTPEQSRHPIRVQVEESNDDHDLYSTGTVYSFT